ncbi:MAG: hypothetical protein ACRYFW_12450 [Janthinobacterium lividum]
MAIALLLATPAVAGNHERFFPALLVKPDRLTEQLQRRLKKCGIQAKLMREDPRRTSWVPRHPKPSGIAWLQFPTRDDDQRFWSGFDPRNDYFISYALSRNVELIPTSYPVS